MYDGNFEMGQLGFSDSSKRESRSMNEEITRRMPLVLALFPWFIILFAGTIGFVRLEGLQNVLHAQQLLNAQQVKTNEKLTLDGTLTLNRSLLKQCLEEYNVDDKLSVLGSDLLSSRVLDLKSKLALADFAKEVKDDQVKLRCSELQRKKT